MQLDPSKMQKEFLDKKLSQLDNWINGSSVDITKEVNRYLGNDKVNLKENVEVFLKLEGILMASQPFGLWLYPKGFCDFLQRTLELFYWNGQINDNLKKHITGRLQNLLYEKVEKGEKESHLSTPFFENQLNDCSADDATLEIKDYLIKIESVFSRSTNQEETSKKIMKEFSQVCPKFSKAFMENTNQSSSSNPSDSTLILPNY